MFNYELLAVMVFNTKEVFDISIVKAIINTDDVWKMGNVSVKKER